MKKVLLSVIMVFLMIGVPSVVKAEETKPPVTQYWMTIVTQNMIIPGMSSEEMSGMEGMMGKMAGMPGFGPTRTLLLQLNSPKGLPPAPEATHDVPPAQNMGKTLPLAIPVHEKAIPEKYEIKEGPEEKLEKPKARMLIYWGCGEEVRKGQPLVIDTEKMSPIEFGNAFAGRTPTHQSSPSERKGGIYADWPNRKSSLQVPKDSSLKGDHLVHGNYTPDIRFSVGAMHDFMAPVEFTSMKGGLAESIRFDWKSIPTAIGYFATAMAHAEKTGETIFWSSSEVKETGFSLMDYLTPGDVRKFIKEKIVMEPKTTSCAIPRGIFKDAGGGMLQFIAYGEEMNLVHPPKPKDPKEPWNPIWTLKLRLKSTGMVPLSDEMAGRESRRPGRQRIERFEEEPVGKSPEQPSEQLREPEPEPESPPPPPGEEGTFDKVKKFKGLFGF